VKFKKRLACLLLAILLAVLSSGCSIGFVDVEQLMTPPQTTGTREALHRLLTQDAGTLNLVYPNSGDYRSAFIAASFAGKDTPGAIAFTANSEGGTTLYFALQENGEWRITSKISNTSSQVDRVCFADLNDDGRQEVVVSWGSVQALASILSVYTYNGETVLEYSLARPFGEFSITDLDMDGKQELFIAEAYHELDTANIAAEDTPVLALLYRLGYGGLEITQTVELDPAVRRYTQLVNSGLPRTAYGGSAAVLLDGIRADGTVVTQLVYINPRTNTLSAPFSGTSNVTTRASMVNVTSRDIDGDGIYEFPVVHPLPTPENTSAQSVSFLVNWQKFTPGKDNTETVKSVIFNHTDGYMLEVPREWLNDTVTCRYDTTNGILTVYKVEEKEGTVALGAALLRIRRYSKLEWESLASTESYTAVYAQNNIVFAATLPAGNSPLSLPLSRVSELIHPISE